MKHTKAQNVIERTFGLLKMHWGILRSPSFYPIKTHNRIIMACCLLLNYIRQEMIVDLMEHNLDNFLNNQQADEETHNDVIDVVQTTTEWTNKRNTMELPIDGQKDVKQKTIKTRRVWTQLKEEALIKCLKEIIPQGWKADNGFKVGYLRELEKEMIKIFPGTDIRPYPHIHSKLHVWKKDYSSIVSALSKSGISTTKTIDVEQEEAWEAYKRDRATGEQAEDIVDVVNNLYNSNAPASETGSPFNGVSYEPGDDAGNNYVCQQDAEGDDFPRSAKRAQKCQSSNGEASSILNTLGNFMENTDSRLGEIAQRIRY
ncbi:hypothetical protein ACS0TY_003657 [Phlomoides rotata]